MGWAVSHGYVKTNVGGECLDGALPKQRNGKTHFRALPYQEVGSALGVVESSAASQSVKLAVYFVALTACRSNEVRGARWSEIDLERKEWRVPADRMKAGKEHRVPLSDAAQDGPGESQGIGRWQRAGVPFSPAAG